MLNTRELHYAVRDHEILRGVDFVQLQRRANDLPMLESVGWPVAVGNAIDEVKRACRIVAPACADDGVAKALEKYVLGGMQA